MEVAEGEVPTPAKLRRLRVVDLRKRLHSVELPQSGNKEELIARLHKFYVDQRDKMESERVEKEEEEEEKGATEGEVEERGEEGVSDEAERKDDKDETEKGESERVEEEEEKGDTEGETEEKGEEGVADEAEKYKDETEKGIEDMQVESAEQVTEPEPPGPDPEGTLQQTSLHDTRIAQDHPPIGQQTSLHDTRIAQDHPPIGQPEAAPDRTAPLTDQDKEEKSDEREKMESEGVEKEEEEDEKGAIEGEVKEKGEEVMSDEAEKDKDDDKDETEKGIEEMQVEMTEQVTEPAEVPNVEPVQSESSKPVTTSDYYSDSAREEMSQPVLDHPSIAQDHSPIIQPVAAPDRAAPLTDQNKEKKSDEPKGKKKKKRRRRRRHNEGAESKGGAREGENQPPEVEIEYVQEDLLKPGDTHYKQFHKIFEAFKLSDESEATPKATPISMIPDDDSMSIAAKSAAAQKKQREEESEDEEEPKEPAKLSKKKLRKLNRLTVAQLKQLVDRPDVVEMHDVTAQDPKLLIHLKSTRNTVPVPRHWCFKRKYLQGKRGIEKPPFNLPDFIKATGIMEMRQALEEKEDAKSLKQKTRERVRPKMGKLTIDYQKLHDAFFRWQTKPKMTIHGDIYYEGKEFETRLREKKPGDLSDDLRRALGMPTGMGKEKFPPPWLVAMQRYGPPPSYLNLKIPGLNAPIPEGCSFGYFVGGWGKPPVDELGRPLYGDVFGLDNPDNIPRASEEDIDKQLWGELESEEEMEEEEESGEEEGEMKAEDLQAGLITPIEGGLVTPSGLTSIPAGLETPEMIQLRKKKIEEAMEQGGDTPALYTVLPEKTQTVGAALMGSSHVYDISAAVPGANKKAGGGAGAEGVEVALDPSELDLDAATMTARYEEQLKEAKLQKEDLSDMVAEHAAKQKKRKRAAADSGGGKATKKLKEFKF